MPQQQITKSRCLLIGMLGLSLPFLLASGCAENPPELECARGFKNKFEGIAFLASERSLTFSLTKDCSLQVLFDLRFYSEFSRLYSESPYDTIIRPVRVSMEGPIILRPSELGGRRRVFVLKRLNMASADVSRVEFESAAVLNFGTKQVQ